MEYKKNRNVATSNISDMVWLNLLPIHRRGGSILFLNYCTTCHGACQYRRTGRPVSAIDVKKI
jgi:hypothetical protein